MKDEQTVNFISMKDGISADYALLEKLEKPYLVQTAEPALSELEKQGQVSLVFPKKAYDPYVFQADFYNGVLA